MGSSSDLRKFRGFRQQLNIDWSRDNCLNDPNLQSYRLLDQLHDVQIYTMLKIVPLG